MAEKPATRKDLARLGRRLDGRIRSHVSRLDTKIDRVAASLIRTQADVSEIKEKMATKDDIRTIITAVHRMSDELQPAREERARIPVSLDRHGETLRNHEKRITTLESIRR